MSLKRVAAQTLETLEVGFFLSRDGERISIQPTLAHAIEGTRLYTPDEAVKVLEGVAPPQSARLRVEVTDETTQVAARRLVVEGVTDLVLLNFASARNPGGGFLKGAKAQEEDLMRCSGLYPCLIAQPSYYRANRLCKSALYTDHLIYSPSVPWFRTCSRDVPDTVFLASVITAPAPNSGVALERDPNCGLDIENALRRRAGLVLAVAMNHGHRNLLLGAWGCGVFRNSPALVADAFGSWLTNRFRGVFDRVVFAIYDRSPQQDTVRVFRNRFKSYDCGSPRLY